MAPPSADVEAPDAGLEWFREQMRITVREWKSFQTSAEERGFQLAGVAQLDLIFDVWKALEKAINDGTTLEDFKAAVTERLTAAWGEENPQRVETIFRTNVQKAYSAGRMQELNRPTTRAIRPFWKYSAVLDSRTSETCRPLNGTILANDHPFWATHTPPLHFRCRSAIISLTEEAAAEEGIAPHPPSAAAPTKGFGTVEEDKSWEPNLEEYPPALVRIFERGQ